MTDDTLRASPVSDEVLVEETVREAIATIIYQRGMRYLRTDVPAWVERGNSLAQDEARRIAEDVLAHLRERGMLAEWRPIDDEAKSKGKFLALIEGDAIPAVVEWSEYDFETASEIGEDGFWAFSEDVLADLGGEAVPTHWMPLPAPPTGETK